VTLRPIALAACAAAILGCSRTGAESAHTPVVAVRTAAAVRGPFAHVIGSLGTVSPRAGRYAELSAPAPTRVARIFVAAGDPVAAGAPLVEFERAPFEAAARSAESALASAQHGYDRAVRLTQAGVLARKDLDLAAADLAQAQSAAVTARRSLELATLRAPIAGVVTRMTAVLGAPADPGQAVVAVADPSALDLLFAVSAADAAVIRRGAPVAVFAGEDARGERLGAAQVIDIGAMVDSAARSVTVRARMTGSGRPLRIGETVFGRITSGVQAAAVIVPLAALVPDGEGYRVFVVDAANVAHARAITVGGRGEGTVEILSGLAAGEIVVTEGAYGVEDSARVVPARDSAPAASRP
jgi:membrane fusion protein (multidrug efflux system)